MAQIQRIYSHEEALNQCTRWLERNMPGVQRIPVASTAHAAELASKDVAAAAICSQLCTELYPPLKCLGQDLQDLDGNTTRFVVLSQASDTNTGQDKTLILFSVRNIISR